MPPLFRSTTGTCANCGQHWIATYPAFDVRCPRCDALVMRLSAVSRWSGAAGMALAVALAGVLVAAALLVLGGRTAAIVALASAASAALALGMWTYRAVRSHRTSAQPLSHFEGGIVKP